MTIYTYDKVTEFLTQLNLGSIYRNKREHYIKTQYPEIHQEVYDTTQFLVSPSFTERLFYYTNNITSHEKSPKCKWCGKPVNYNPHECRFHDFCSSNSGCGFKYFNKQHGIQSSSQLQSVKDSYKATCLKKHGVDHASKAPAVRAKISAGKKAGKDRAIVDLVENLGCAPLNMTKDEYYQAVHRITEHTYSRNIDILDPNRMRSPDFHIDHQVSVYYGYQNEIPPYIIGDITNLRMIDRTSNISKGYRNSITIHELIENYNNHYGTTEQAPSSENLEIPKAQIGVDNGLKMTFYVEEAGVCHLCGGEAHYVRKDDGAHQCTPQKKHCPVMKKLYSKQRNINHKLALERKKQQSSE